MPISPSDVAALTLGERMIAILTISQIDYELTQHYDGSGFFTLHVTRVPGMSEKVANDIVKQYRLAGWRGSRYSLSPLTDEVIFDLVVREQE